MPLASVIVTCYSLNRIKDIKELLVSLKNQTYYHSELIIVVEKSKELLAALEVFASTENIDNVHFLFSEQTLGLSGARNMGIKQAKGSIIAIIDDDAEPTIFWLEAGVKYLHENSSVIGATGPAIAVWRDKPLDWLPQELSWIVGSSTWYNSAKICNVRHAWGMNMIFKREAFECCGGLSETHGLKRGETEGFNRFPHEDVEFSLRVKRCTGKCIVYIPQMKVYHKISSNKMNVRFFAQHAYVQGFAKRMVQELGRNFPGVNGVRTLNREYTLLRTILVVVFPKAVLELPKKPATSMRQLLTISVVLSFLLIGYVSPLYPLVRRKKSQIPIIFP